LTETPSALPLQSLACPEGAITLAQPDGNGVGIVIRRGQVLPAIAIEVAYGD
jgi:hypothetical protein